MSVPSVTLRRPGPDDAVALADLHVRTWRETYAHLLPAAAVGEEFRAGRLRMWQSVLAENHGLPEPTSAIPSVRMVRQGAVDAARTCP